MIIEETFSRRMPQRHMEGMAVHLRSFPISILDGGDE